jgi:hypothetical protein
MGFQLLSFGNEPEPTHIVINAEWIIDLSEDALIKDADELVRSLRDISSLAGLEESQIPAGIDNAKIWTKETRHSRFLLGLISSHPSRRSR